MKLPATPAVLLGLIGFSIVAAAQTAPPQVVPPPHVQPSQYQVCNGYFALCTLAKCGEPPAKGSSFQPTSYSCAGCFVLTGSSVAAVPPAPACMLLSKQPSAGQHIQSRFAVITDFNLATCTNNNVWANCLNATCTVDKNTNYATCTCLPQTSTPYVSGGMTVLDSNSGCLGHPVISSESSTDATAIGTFWTDNGLKPFKLPAAATSAKK